MTTKLLLKRTVSTAATLGLALVPAVALGQKTIDLGLENIGENLGLSTNTEVRTVIANIIRVLLGFLGIIAVIIVLYGGFQWMTAAGNEEKISSARSTLTAGLIGLIIILAAFAIASFIINTILEQTA
jgi:hypothetical protein